MPKKVGRPAHLANAISETIASAHVAGKRLGDRLPVEEDLVKLYGVSRGTIRSALQILERKGDILRLPSKGAVVMRGWSNRRQEFGGGQIVLLNAKFHYQYPLADVFWQSVLRGIHAFYYPLRQDIVLSFLNLRHMAGLNELIENHVGAPNIRGVILLGKQPERVYEAIKSVKKPAVSIDYSAISHGINSVVFDNRKAGISLAKWAWSLGIRHILTINEDSARSAELSDQAWAERRDGFSKAWLTQSGTTISPVIIKNRNDIFLQAQAEVVMHLHHDRERMIKGLILPTAEEAERWHELIRKIGRIPGCEFSIFYHGIPDAEHGNLSGFQYNAIELGRVGSRLLMRFMTQRKTKLRTRKPVTELVPAQKVSGSTHSPKKGR